MTSQALVPQTVTELTKLGVFNQSPIVGDDGIKTVIVPRDHELRTIDPPEEKLYRINQYVSLHDRDSLISYVNRYKTSETRLFAEPGFLSSGGAHISAVLDYRGPGAPDYCAHNAIYRPRYSDQWKTWQKACSATLKQAEFAEFIEENRKDIVEPSAANLLDVVRTFKASKRTDFDSLTYQSNGNVKLHYAENTEQQGASGSLPEKMNLGIPVYFRGVLYAVEVFVRYRVGNGGVVFDLKLDRADVIEDEAFKELTVDVSNKTEIECYLGHRG